MKHAVVLAAVVGAAAASRVRCTSCPPECYGAEAGHEFQGGTSKTSGPRGRCASGLGPDGHRCPCPKFTTEENRDAG